MTSPAEMTCKICKNSEENRAFQIREMMYGTGEEFTYFECSRCGCLQIADVPRELSKYYPSSYMPHVVSQQSARESCTARCLKKLWLKRDEYSILGTSLVGRLVNVVYPNSLLKMIAMTATAFDQRILDVGCGSGGLLVSLKSFGFRNLTGIDPYGPKETVSEGLRIMRGTIDDLPDTDTYRLIVFNHSLEHIPDQMATLSKVARILATDGVCLIRMPVKTETVWRMYGVNWVQIDAPRHLIIHTTASLRYLSQQAGLKVKRVVFDSDPFLFWGSERYQKGIPLMTKRADGANPVQWGRRLRNFRRFWKMAAELNRQHQGDQAVFFLVHDVG